MRTQLGARLRKTSAKGMTVAYLHTLDGKPAYFDGEQLVFAEQLPHWQDQFDACRCCTTVDQIDVQQHATERYRLKHGWDVPPMGYVVIAVKVPRG